MGFSQLIAPEAFMYFACTIMGAWMAFTILRCALAAKTIRTLKLLRRQARAIETEGFDINVLNWRLRRTLTLISENRVTEEGAEDIEDWLADSIDEMSRSHHQWLGFTGQAARNLGFFFTLLALVIGLRVRPKTTSIISSPC